MQVSYKDPSCRHNIGEFMKLAIPSMLFILINWSAYDVQTLIAGLINVDILACQVIYLQFIFTAGAIPLGIQLSACTLIGNQIGKQNVAKAKELYVHIFKFALVIMIIDLGCITIF